MTFLTTCRNALMQSANIDSKVINNKPQAEKSAHTAKYSP